MVTDFFRSRELGMVIAERQLFLDGEATVRARIGEPLLSDDDPPFAGCLIQIEGIGSGRMRFIYGEDRMQALWLALQALGSELYASEEYETGRLTAFSDSDTSGDLHLPVLKAMEDLVRGTSAETP